MDSRLTPDMPDMPDISDIPDILICPITHLIFKEPVVAEDGNFYEREAIKDWLQINKKSPITRSIMAENLYPANKIKNMVDEYIQLNPNKKNEQYDGSPYKFIDIIENDINKITQLKTKELEEFWMFLYTKKPESVRKNTISKIMNDINIVTYIFNTLTLYYIITTPDGVSRTILALGLLYGNDITKKHILDRYTNGVIILYPYILETILTKLNYKYLKYYLTKMNPVHFHHINYMKNIIYTVIDNNGNITKRQAKQIKKYIDKLITKQLTLTGEIEKTSLLKKIRKMFKKKDGLLLEEPFIAN